MQEHIEEDSEGTGEALLPEASVGHLCGEVGFAGVISDAAMRNFLARVFLRIERFLKVSVGNDSAEFGVSIAIFPLAHSRIEIEPFSGTFAGDALEKLQGMLDAVPKPSVQNGPFACVVYRRWNQETPTIRKLSAFPSMSQEISQWGLEETLRRYDTSFFGGAVDCHTTQVDSDAEPLVVSGSPTDKVDAGVTASVGSISVGLSEKPQPHPEESAGADRKPGPRVIQSMFVRFWRKLRKLGSVLGRTFTENTKEDHSSQPQEATQSEGGLPEFADQELLLGKIAEQAENASLDDLKEVAEGHAAKASDRLALAIKYTEVQEWSAAEEALTRAIELLPPLAALHAYRAKLHRVQGQSAAALADLNRAIDLAPEQVTIRADRAELYGELTAWQAAEEDLEFVVEQSTREPDYLMRYAEAKMRLEKYQDAVEILQTLLLIDPNHGPAHNLLGWLYHEHYENLRADALFHFGEAVEIVPQEVGPRIYRCLIYLAENKLALAEEECQAILKLDPESPPALGLRGRILQMEGEYEEAIDSCTRAIDAGFETSLVLLARALSYANLDQFEAAMRDCQATLQAEPEMPLAHYLLGQLHLQEEELDEAEEAFLLAAKYGDDDWTEPREKLALIQRMRENPEAAAEAHSALIEENPEQVSNYVNRALAYAEAGQFELAESDFANALRMEPENERIYVLRGHYWGQRQEYERALFDLDRALELMGDDDGTRFQRASVLVNLRRHDDAIRDFDALINKYPEDPRAHAARCYVRSLKGDQEGAEADLQAARDLGLEQSERLQSQVMLGRCGYLVDKEEYDEAEAIAMDLIDQFPEEASGFRVKGYVHWCREEYVEAIDEYTAALELVETAVFLSARGQLRGEVGEYDDALSDLEKAIQMSRKSGENLTLAYALNGRAMVFAALERWDEAERDFEESILLAPGNPWVHYHRGVALYRRKALAESKIVLGVALGLQEPMLPTRKRERARWILDKLQSEMGEP